MLNVLEMKAVDLSYDIYVYQDPKFDFMSYKFLYIIYFCEYNTSCVL